MSLQKTAAQAMQYEATPVKKVNSKRVAIKYAQELSSTRLIWVLVTRHKVGLLAIGNIILVLNYVFPEWTELLKSFI